MSTYSDTFGTGSHTVKGILKYYWRGNFTLKETYARLKNHVLWCFDEGYLTETEADACIAQIDRFYAGKINADDLQTYLGAIV